MILLAGCQHYPTRYAWGSYETLIYVSYAEPGQMTPEAQVDTLEKDEQLAASKKWPMPPGWHAHLGYLYAQIGRPEDAARELAAEKTEFPESAVFVDHLLDNLKRPQPQ